MFQPLQGTKVVDLSQVLAGPFATYQLGLMGAEIIKVEMPGSGDWTRRGESLPGSTASDMGLAYLTQNAGKRSVTLDLKSEDGLALAKRLIAGADIFVENFKPGVAARLGLSFEAVRQINPQIVYCSISAYGQDGPIGHRPAYDHVVQGMCGIMRTTGTPETEPNKVGAPYIDYATGMNAALAMVSALHEAQRTAEAVHVDVAMLDTALVLMASLMTKHLSTDWRPGAYGNEAWSQSPSSGAFETADGTLMIAANNERQFKALCHGLGRADLLDDPRFHDAASVRDNAPQLRQELAAIFETATADDWEARLDRAGVPAARIRHLHEVLAEDQAKARQIMAEVEMPGGGAVHVPTLGFKANGAAVGPAAAPPRLGQDTALVLREIGLSDAEIEDLSGRGVI